MHLILILVFILSLAQGHASFALEKPPEFAGSFGKLNRAEMYPTDIAVDTQGNVYILDELNRRVHKRDPQNNLLLQLGSNGYGDGEFVFPRSIALDTEGKIYVTDGMSNRIQKFDVDGSFIRGWNADYPIGIAVSPTGLVYVAEAFTSKIQVYDTDGNFMFNWGEKGSTGGQLLKPYYIALDNDNNVWVTDETAHRVIKYNQNGNYILSFGGKGTAPGEFKAPTGITVDKGGFVYVYDRWNQRVQKFDQEGNFIMMWGEGGNGNGQLHGLGMASDEGSHIYIADYWNFRAQKFTSTGQFLYKWTGTVTGDGEFASVHDLIVNDSGKVYAVDRHTQNVQVFDSAGNFLFKWGTRGKREWFGPYFNFPRAIAVDTANNVYISNDKDIRVFDEYGSNLGYWAVPSSVTIPGPLGVDIDNNGNIFITSLNHEVIKVDKNGIILKRWGTYGNANGQFKKPSGIGADSEGNIYVCDMGNKRVQKFSNNGEYLLSWGSYGYSDGQFIRPVGLAVDRENNIYVVDEYKAQVQKFDSNGNFLTKWGQLGSGNGEFNRPLYIAIDHSGKNIYVSDNLNGRVQKFTYERASLSLTPDVTIAPEGGVLGFYATVTNNTYKARKFYFATNVTLPDGNTYPPLPVALYGPVQVILAPYETLSYYITQDVPVGSPLGIYVYNGYIGKGLWTIWSEDHFQFTVTPDH